MKFYFSFGQNHSHSYNSKTVDKDYLVEIECETMEYARVRAFQLFGNQWSMVYKEDELADILRYFPKGIIKCQ